MDGNDGGSDSAGSDDHVYSVNEELSDLPTGTWAPDTTSGARVTSDSSGTRIDFDDGGYIETGGYRYTCQGSDGCEIDNRTVVSGSIVQSAVAAQPADTMPSFAADSGPGDQAYEVDAAIDALTLPTATGGDGTLSYGLSPEVPGLSFDAASRQLTGTPTTAGTYNMTYTATDGDGDTDSLSFAIVVEDNDAPEVFDLHQDNGRPVGIVYASDRYFVVDGDDRKVYAYRDDGQHDAAADFGLHDDNGSPIGVGYADSQFVVLDTSDRKAYVYGDDGQRNDTAEFDLVNFNPRRITFANNLFFVLDNIQDKVFAYQSDGQRIATADFDLDDGNGTPEGIAYGNGRFYVADHFGGKVYAYTDNGQRDGTADFDVPDFRPSGIAYGDSRFLRHRWRRPKGLCV